MDHGSEDARLRDAFRRMAPAVDATAFYRDLAIKLTPSSKERWPLTAVADGRTDGGKRTSVPGRRRGLRAEVFAAVAIALVAAITVGSLEAGKHLGKGQPVVVITDDTVGMSPSSTGAVTSSSPPVTTLPATSPRLLWKVATGSRIAAPPLVSAGLVYVGGTDGSLHALDAQTGAERWKLDLRDGQLRFASAIVDGILFFASENHNLYAVDAQTGRQQWTFETGGIVKSSPVISAGVVYAGSRDFYLYAVDAKTGRQIWRFWTGGPIDASPAVSGNVVCVTSEDGWLYAVDAQTGAQRWRFRIGDGDGGLFGSPAVADGVVYVRGDDHLYALALQTGAEKWRYRSPAPTNFSSAAISLSQGVVYLNVSGGLFAVSAKDGTELWRSSAPGVATEPFAWEGEVYVGGGGWGDSSLHGFDAQTGQEDWLFDIRGGPGISRPTISDGVVYFGDSDGRVFAVKPEQ